MYAAALQALELWPGGAMAGVHGRFFESPAFEVDVLCGGGVRQELPAPGAGARRPRSAPFCSIAAMRRPRAPR